MAYRYLKATGNWADNNTWSSTDGGEAGASRVTVMAFGGLDVLF